LKYTTQSDNTSLKKGVTLEAGEIIKVGNTTLRIDFLTKSNGEKVALIKEVLHDKTSESSSKKYSDNITSSTQQDNHMVELDVPSATVAYNSSKSN